MYNGIGNGKERKTPPKFPVVDEEIKRRGNVRQFADASGFCQSSYYKMQSGETSPTLGMIYAVLDYTGLSFDAAFRV